MALATQCPHCHTTFRVASDQLKLRGGIVRCGACQSIFDGSAHLIDLELLAASKAQAAPAPQLEPQLEPQSEPQPEPQPEPLPAAEGDDAPAGDDDAAPVYTLDFDHTFDPLGILPEAPAPLEEAHDEPAPAPAPPASAFAPHDRIEPSFELPVDEELVAQPLPGDEDLEHEDAALAAVEAAAGSAADPMDEVPPAALPLRASAAGDDTLTAPAAAPVPAKSARAKAIEARTRRSKMTPTRIAAPKLRVPAIDPDEPEFVKRSRKQEASGQTRRRLMIAGALVLALLLAFQTLLEFRNVLAARYPAARPLLAAGCTLLRCHIGLPSQIDSLAIETGELSTLGVDTYSLNTLLRNQGSLVQAWPSIQLELTDANDKPVLRRVFSPAEYLPQGVSAAAGFGARSEQPVRLNFALTDLKPSGYHMIIFYQDPS
jgi:predicted Zn finger-like uncharacterized protein